MRPLPLVAPCMFMLLGILFDMCRDNDPPPTLSESANSQLIGKWEVRVLKENDIETDLTYTSMFMVYDKTSPDGGETEWSVNTGGNKVSSNVYSYRVTGSGYILEVGSGTMDLEIYGSLDLLKLAGGLDGTYYEIEAEKVR